MQGVGGKLELTPAYRLPREASWAVCGRTQIYTDPNVHEVFVVICIQSLAPQRGTRRCAGAVAVDRCSYHPLSKGCSTPSPVPVAF